MSQWKYKVGDTVRFDCSVRWPDGTTEEKKIDSTSRIDKLAADGITGELGYMSECHSDYFVRNALIFIPESAIKGLVE